MSPLQTLLAEFQTLETQLADADVIADQSRYTALSRKYASLQPVAAVAREIVELQARVDDAKGLLSDPDLGELARADLEEGEAKLPALRAQYEELTLNRDPADERDVIMEIRSGTGGAEAALFAADLFRMYTRYAENRGYKLEVVDSSESDLGGLSRLTAEIRGAGAFGVFKFESGVHRVQRIPATETQGRIHTSTATVAVLPEAEDVDVHLEPSDYRVDVYRSGGHGGQGVNTTDSAVRVVYREGTPEELVVTCQDGRSQLKNREKALTVLRARLFERAREEAQRNRSEARSSQIGTGERSEKIRTYNYPQNRVTDHRLEGEGKNHPLETVIEGDLSGLIAELKAMERRELLLQKVSA
jgi:peptide chain release factor 1